MSEQINLEKVNDDIKQLYVDYFFLKGDKLTAVFIYPNSVCLQIKTNIKSIICLCCLLPFRKINDRSFWFSKENSVQIIANYD